MLRLDELADQVSRDRRSADAEEYRRLYKTARWQALRMRVLTRDSYQCQQCRALLRPGRAAPNSAVVHHKTPHKGDLGLFYDEGNCEAVCKQCHDGVIQSDEARGYSNAIGEDGWPMDPAHHANTGKIKERFGYSIPDGCRPSGIPVHLVYGPPAAGKTTFVRHHAKPGDTIIDLDDIKVQLGGRRWDREWSIARRALAYRRGIIRNLADRTRGECWLIATAPTKAERRQWAKALGPVIEHRVVADEDECIQRIKSDPARAHATQDLEAGVRRWFAIAD